MVMNFNRSSISNLLIFTLQSGVPDNIDPIIQMLDYVHFKLNESSNGKNQHLVVHCSAGCGRTGTIIALDYCWNLLTTGKLPSDFSPFKIGKMLREQRTAMIQTFVSIVFYFYYFIIFSYLKGSI